MSAEHGKVVAGIVSRLLADTVPGETLTLDALGEAIGSAPVSTEDIGTILDVLEREGRVVSQPTLDVASTLREVLGAARAFRANHGTTPSVQDIEQATQLDRAAVLTALRFADTLKR